MCTWGIVVKLCSKQKSRVASFSGHSGGRRSWQRRPSQGVQSFQESLVACRWIECNAARPNELHAGTTLLLGICNSWYHCSPLIVHKLVRIAIFILSASSKTNRSNKETLNTQNYHNYMFLYFEIIIQENLYLAMWHQIQCIFFWTKFSKKRFMYTSVSLFSSRLMHKAFTMWLHGGK